MTISIYLEPSAVIKLMNTFYPTSRDLVRGIQFWGSTPRLLEEQFVVRGQ